MEFLYLCIQQKSSIPLGGPLFLHDSDLPYCCYRDLLRVSRTFITFSSLLLLLLLDSIEKTYDADIALAL
jgi:hypothetical protein